MYQPLSALIQLLSPEQAQRALLLFYEALPTSAWEGAKPAAADVAAWLDDAQDFLPAETLTVIDALLGEGGNDFKGNIAKLLLDNLRGHEVLRPYVAQAVSRACEPCTKPTPSILGAFLVALAVFPLVPCAHSDAAKPLRIRWNPAENAGDLVNRIAAIASFIPKHVLEAASAPACPAREAPAWRMQENAFAAASV